MNESIKNIEEFIAWTGRLEGGLLVYRGLADTTWEVSASAYRRIKTSPDETPPTSVFQNYMKRLLNNASLRGFREQQGRSHTDLELLAELQRFVEAYSNRGNAKLSTGNHHGAIADYDKAIEINP